MTDTPQSGAALQDWITIWQSELAALAADREVQEAAQRAVDFWAAQAAGAAMLLDPARRPAPATDAAAGSAGPAAAAGAASAVAASAERDAVIAQLLARVAELERRLGAPPPA